MVFSFSRSTAALFLLKACCLCFSGALFADPSFVTHTQKPKNPAHPFPWLTGPLLTPSAHVVPNGHINYEPYEFVTTNYGFYDANWHAHSSPKFYNINTEAQMQFGLPYHLDFKLIPVWSWNHTEGASHWVLNDIRIGLNYQLLNNKPGKWWPAIKLLLRGVVPVGKYQKLNPKSKGTDIGGTGSWLPAIGISMSHLYWWGGRTFFAPRFFVLYTVPTPVHVKNLNIYGGGRHTHGTVVPGQSLEFLFGFEISLTQRWALAGDVSYLHINKTRFHGHKGATDGIPNRIGLPSSESLSLAPAIEYNWSSNVGIIAGVWFAVAGRNQLEFASGIVAVNIYH